ncbi:MAG: TIM barrel protein, partial [Solirubrobacteraceae bacterium]
YVSDYEHAWSIVSAARHPALGVCLDSFYILSGGADVRGLRGIPGDKIFFVQLADATRPGNHVLRWGRHHRCFPGQGCLDVAGFMAETLATGYDGPMSIEVFNDGLGQPDAERVAVDAMRSLLLLEDDLEESRLVGHGALPRPGALGGYTFIELTLDFGSLFVLEQLLHVMGFSNAAAHSSRRVDLWQQGAIRVVLSRDESADAPQLAAIGVESTDPAGSLRRAQDLRATAVALREGPADPAISAITAPDGTGIFFCRTSQDGGSSWRSDFRPLPDLGNHHPARLLAIDHVGLPQSLDCFDESILFYRSVLGLAARAGDEQVSPGGVSRSRALADVRAGLRFVLNAEAPGDGRRGIVSAAQHVAFSCKDVLSTARSFIERGIPIVPVSHNYYDDLAARFELEPALLRQLKDSDVLYDRTPDGEFLHFYVEVQGASLCFEVVERRGLYSGYGAANAPVRDAALGTRSVSAAGP